MRTTWTLTSLTTSAGYSASSFPTSCTWLRKRLVVVKNSFLFCCWEESGVSGRESVKGSFFYYIFWRTFGCFFLLVWQSLFWKLLFLFVCLFDVELHDISNKMNQTILKWVLNPLPLFKSCWLMFDVGAWLVFFAHSSPFQVWCCADMVLFQLGIAHAFFLKLL